MNGAGGVADPSGGTEVAGPQRIRSASTAITDDLVSALRRRHDHYRLAVPLRLTDRFLDDLEQLNLTGRRRVPADWEPRLAGLLACLPAEVHDVPDLRTRVLPTRLMDSLFELQDQLLDLKLGPIRPLLHALDQGILDSEQQAPSQPGEDRTAVA